MIDSPWGPLPWWLVYPPVTVLGLALGSFANVLIHRLPLGESIVNPPSRCPKCGRQISALENIPVVSWLFLRARCRTCGTPISVRYPLVEIAGAELTILAVQLYGLHYAGAAYSLLFVALLALVIIDLEQWLLPFAITIPMTVIGLVGSVFFHLRPVADSLIGLVAGAAVLGGMGVLGTALFRRKAGAEEATDDDAGEDDHRDLVLPHIVTIGTLILLVVIAFFIRLGSVANASSYFVVFALPFLFVWAMNRFVFRTGAKSSGKNGFAFGRATEDIEEELKDAGAMGGGDIVFGMMAGVFLGWKLVLLMTFMASFLGTFLAMLMVVRGISIKNLKIQFGPLLAVSAVFCLLIGDRIVNWYVAFLSR